MEERIGELRPSTDKITLQAGDALIVVDVQCDFLPGGALAVPDGDQVVPTLNRYLALFGQHKLPTVFTRDWHPADHCSFRPQGGPWPPHCVAQTRGAAFAPGLEVPADVIVISKAVEREPDAYSGFQRTGLGDLLRQRACKRVFVGGLATDYCVLATVCDALGEGFAVVLLRDAIRPVNVNPGDGIRAEQKMEKAGARLASFDLLNGVVP